MFQFVNGTKVLEKSMGTNLIGQNMMLSYYRPIVKREVELGSVKQHHQVLCVGGGYFPSTGILFHQLSGATVHVIDNDMEAVLFSQKLIEKMGLSKEVIVSHSDGIDSTAKNFDVVHIAMQISPKEEVFDHLHSTMVEYSKILIRTPKQHLERGYEPFRQIADQWVKQMPYSNIERTMLYVR